MSTVRITICVIAISFSSFSNSLDLNSTKDWNLVKKKNDIHVFIGNIEGSRIKGVKGSALFPGGSLDDLEGTMGDFNNYSRWLHAVNRSEKFEKNGEPYMRLYLNLPWPMKNRDLVYKLVTSAKSDDYVEYRFESTPDILPRDPDYVRIEEGGSILSASIKDDRVIFEFSHVADLGGRVPVFLINTVIDDGAYFSMRRLRRLMEHQ